MMTFGQTRVIVVSGFPCGETNLASMPTTRRRTDDEQDPTDTPMPVAQRRRTARSGAGTPAQPFNPSDSRPQLLSRKSNAAAAASRQPSSPSTPEEAIASGTPGTGSRGRAQEPPQLPDPIAEEEAEEEEFLVDGTELNDFMIEATAAAPAPGAPVFAAPATEAPAAAAATGAPGPPPDHPLTAP